MPAAKKAAPKKKAAAKKDQPVDTLVLFTLDMSGSMGNLTDTTIEGVNQFLTEQSEVEGNCWFSLTLFDDQFDVRYSAVDVREVPKMTRPGAGPNPYFVRGSTALFDAVGVTIRGGEAWLANNTWFKGKVMLVIWTDGGENASKQWHILDPQQPGDDFDLGALLTQKQGEGWDVVFMGTGEGWVSAKKMAPFIPRENVVLYTNDMASASANYASVSSSVTQSRLGGQSLRVANKGVALDEDGKPITTP
jgi:hypothetical protein